MNAHRLTFERKRSLMAGLASPADFRVSTRRAVDAGIVCTQPNISLYCLDDEAQQALFVELPVDVDLSRAPFIYQTQYERVQGLIAVPYSVFKKLAQALPAIEHLIMIYMTGRSGSTLLSHVFSELDTVLALSEPDAATQFVQLRPADGRRDPELRTLLECTLRFLFKPTPLKTPSTCALKLRNEGVQVMDLYQETFPHAKNLFLYRDAMGFVSSFYRIAKDLPIPESSPVDELLAQRARMLNQEFAHLKAYLDPDQRELSMPQFFTLWWLGVMEHYLAQCARGTPVVAVRYADLNAQPEQVLSAIFAHCGLPPARAGETLAAFGRDAQAGTHFARVSSGEGNPLRLTDAQRQEVDAILKRHPVVNDADFIVPGTLRLGLVKDCGEPGAAADLR